MSDMTIHASGAFEVKLVPQTDNDTTPGRFLLDKRFHGDLQGTSHGQMLTAGDLAKGAAGYVAMEQITGNLHGRTGSFALQHSGAMDNGALHLNITVVPGSGVGELMGIAGSMSIKIEGGKHFYEFEFTLPT